MSRPRPSSIGFARNQDDPRRASLSTLLPGADHVFTIPDPVERRSSDRDSRPRPARACPPSRNYAEFAALPSASGLVITPWSDDLKSTVDSARLHLAARRPGAHPAADAGGDVARLRWRASATARPISISPLGSGLGRQLPRHRAQADPDGRACRARSQPRMARLNLARFYLANGFAAEALGLINLMQPNDPALAGDAQLVTMRAAADYMMGRYRDAHNDLAGACLRCRPPCRAVART